MKAATREVTIGVLALQGDVPEHLAMLERCGARAVRVRRPEELSGLQGIVLPGGESTTMLKLAQIFALVEPLREALSAGLPAFGTCAGMIMLADRIEGGACGQETIGGLDVVVRRNAFGPQVESFEATVSVEPAGRTPFDFPASFIRAPWVEGAGADVEVIARIATSGRAVFGPAPDLGPELGRAPGVPPPAEILGRIVAVRQGRLLATSFHPEISGDARIHQLFIDLVRQG